MNTRTLTKHLDKPHNATLFARKFLEGFATPAFGAISKTEVDNLVFALLVEIGSLDPNSQIYEIARDLNVTPSKARNLLFQWQLRNVADADALKDDLVAALRSVRYTKERDLLAFGIESPILREELRSRLKRMGIYADASFSSEIVRLSVKHFVDFLDALLDEPTKKAMQEKLTKDGHLTDKTFKGVAFRILKGIATKAIGQAGGEIAEEFGDAAKGLITGAADLVQNAIGDRDLSGETLDYHQN